MNTDLKVLKAIQLTTAATFQPFSVYLLVAMMYFCLCFPLTRYSRIIERKRRFVR
jgi:polar amino acid transport system permease protein